MTFAHIKILNEKLLLEARRRAHLVRECKFALAALLSGVTILPQLDGNQKARPGAFFFQGVQNLYLWNHFNEFCELFFLNRSSDVQRF